jgi:hypothetical protein
MTISTNSGTMSSLTFIEYAVTITKNSGSVTGSTFTDTGFTLTDNLNESGTTGKGSLSSLTFSGEGYLTVTNNGSSTYGASISSITSYDCKIMILNNYRTVNTITMSGDINYAEGTGLIGDTYSYSSISNLNISNIKTRGPLILGDSSTGAIDGTIGGTITLTNITMNTNSLFSQQGLLFAYSEQETFSGTGDNIYIKDCKLSCNSIPEDGSGYAYVGMICGQISSTGKIQLDEIKVESSELKVGTAVKKVATGGLVGYLIGELSGKVTIDSIVESGNESTSLGVGGVIGKLASSGKLTITHASAGSIKPQITMIGSNSCNLGGLIGYCAGGTIGKSSNYLTCTATVSISSGATASGVGGLIGKLNGSPTINATKIQFAGSIYTNGRLKYLKGSKWTGAYATSAGRQGSDETFKKCYLAGDYNIGTTFTSIFETDIDCLRNDWVYLTYEEYQHPGDSGAGRMAYYASMAAFDLGVGMIVGNHASGSITSTKWSTSATVGTELRHAEINGLDSCAPIECYELKVHNAWMESGNIGVRLWGNLYTCRFDGVISAEDVSKFTMSSTSITKINWKTFLLWRF